VNEMQGGKGSSLYGTVMPSSAQTGGASQRVFSTSRKALTRAELGDTLEEFLSKATTDKNLARLLVCMGEALRTIAFKVRTASCSATACINTFGDEQLAVDLLADKLLFEVLLFSICLLSLPIFLPTYSVLL
jgi:sedoheptulose-bisphosphatase